MSFNIGSIVGNVLPSIMQGAMQGVALSSPQGMLFSMFLNGATGSQGPSIGNIFSGVSNFGALPNLMSKLLNKLAQMGQPSVTKTPGTPQESAAGGAGRTDNSQSKIQSILQGNYSIEEKIILIAGVVSDSVTEELNDCLKEQGKMAKKNTSGSDTASTSSVASAQNVENRIQILMQRLNRMQSLASNMIQSMHATKKAQIMNIRV